MSKVGLSGLLVDRRQRQTNTLTCPASENPDHSQLIGTVRAQRKQMFVDFAVRRLREDLLHMMRVEVGPQVAMPKPRMRIRFRNFSSFSNRTTSCRSPARRHKPAVSFRVAIIEAISAFSQSISNAVPEIFSALPCFSVVLMKDSTVSGRGWLLISTGN